MSAITIRILGSGTSTGVPLIGCNCPVCTSADPHDRRTRFGLWIEADGFAIELDVSPDFREQALRWKLPRVDAVIVSHCHADHVLGLDDMRRYNTLQDCEIPVWACPNVMCGIKRIFDYIAHPPAISSSFRMYRPKLAFHEITASRLSLGPFEIRTLPIPHGPINSTAIEFKCGKKRIVCASDCSYVTPELAEFMSGADLVFLDGLRSTPHSAHLSVEDAAIALSNSHCKLGRIVHIGHNILHSDLAARLPDPLAPSYDGELFEFST